VEGCANTPERREREITDDDDKPGYRLATLCLTAQLCGEKELGRGRRRRGERTVGTVAIL